MVGGSGTGGEAGAAAPPRQRVILVVVDETEEMRNALRYACRRAKRTSGRVALLHVVEPPAELQHWLGVGRVMEEEARAEAEQRVQTLAAEVFAQTGTVPVVHIREGQRAEQLVQLLREDPRGFSLLVLGTASGSDPGPLVAYMLASLGRHIRVPVTLVPGELTTEEIDALS